MKNSGSFRITKIIEFMIRYPLFQLLMRSKAKQNKTEGLETAPL